MKQILTTIMIATVTVGCAVRGPESQGAIEAKDGSGEKTVLTDHDKEYLMNLARQTLYWYLKDGERPVVDEAEISESVKQKLGCFVTLDKRGRGLRGCIGIFERNDELYKNVMSRAIAAAIYDSRFPRVTYGELKDIKLEISVLTAPEPLPYANVDDLLGKLRPEIDGVIIETRHGGSTFLPQVWEQLPDKAMFLTHLCAKHGAPQDEWKGGPNKMRVQTYQAIVFGEEEFGRQVVGRNGARVGDHGATIVGTAVPADADNVVHGEVSVGTELGPGTIVTSASDITDL